MSDVPRTWAETLDRLAERLLRREDADEWLRQALEALWGVQDVGDLPRPRRQVALQKTIGVLLAIEDEYGDVAFLTGTRAKVAAVFARFWGGVRLPGPPWRLDDADEGLPTLEEFAALASFDSPS